MEDRTTYLGGTDASAVLGCNRWKSKLQVWMEKTGAVEIPVLDNEAVKLGTALEDYVAKRFEEETGKKVRRNNRTLRHPEYSFIGANLDREIVGEDSILECKTAGEFKKKEWNDDEIPAEYLIQCHHYLLVTGKKKAYIAVLIGNSKFMWKVIERDDEMLEDMKKKLVEFWENNIVEKVMPMEFLAGDDKNLYNLFPKVKQVEPIDLDKDLDAMFKELYMAKSELKACEDMVKRLENEIKGRLQDNEAGKTDNWMATWKNQSRKSFDSKSFKADNPEIYDKYVKESESRVFRFKPISEEAI